MLSKVGRISLVARRDSFLIRLPGSFNVLPIHHSPVDLGRHQDYLSDMLDQLATRAICLPLLTQVLNLFKLFQVEFPLIFESLVLKLCLQIKINSREIVLDRSAMVAEN